MDNNERRIKELEAEIEKRELVIQDYYERIGEIIFAADDDKKEGSLAGKMLNEIVEIDAELNSERKRIENILSAVDRADEIEALRKNLMQKIRSIEKDNVSNYETIGRASFEAYKDGELPADRYENIFADIIKIMIKIDDDENERNHLSEKEKSAGILQRIKLKARSLYLKNVVSSHYLQLQRQYKKAGEKICNSELVMNLEADSVERALKPYRENLEGIEKLEMEDKKLDSETAKLQGSLEGLGAEANPIRTVNEIEKHVNNLYEKRKSILIESGELIAMNPKDPLAKTSGIKAVLKDISGENDAISSCEEAIKHCEAEMEIERQNKEIRALNKKIVGYEEKIINYSQEADQLKEKIQAVEQNIKKLEKATKDGEEQND